MNRVERFITEFSADFVKKSSLVAGQEFRIDSVFVGSRDSGEEAVLMVALEPAYGGTPVTVELGGILFDPAYDNDESELVCRLVEALGISDEEALERLHRAELLS